MTLEAAEKELALLDVQDFTIPLLSWKPVVQAAFSSMPKRCWIFPGSRARVGAILRGASVQRLADPLNGAKPYKIAPSSTHSARRALHAVGAAIHTQQPTLCILADAALAQGAWTQALNLAGKTQAPVIFLVLRFPLENVGSPLSKQLYADLSSICQSYRLTFMDAPPHEESIKKHIELACQSHTPTLIQTILEK